MNRTYRLIMSDLRIDRFASVHFFHPLTRMEIGRAAHGIPVLMYHSVSDDPETEVSPYYRTATHPDVFDSHMQYLSEHGYTVMHLDAAIDTLETDDHIQGKRVVITFDDGYQDFHTNAFPILKTYGFTAIMFVPTGLINAGRPLKDKPVMTWDEIRELQRQGIQFGSHTVTHPKLQDMPLEDVKYELEISKAHLEEQLGESINTFCYPYAFPEGNATFTRALKEIMINAGYHYATGTRIGTLKKGGDPYLIKRIPMNSCDDVTLLKTKLDGGYDWLHLPQLLFKKLNVIRHSFQPMYVQL